VVDSIFGRFEPRSQRRRQRSLRQEIHASEKTEKTEKTELEAEDDSEVKQVIEMQPFIVNLADQNETRYLRMTISLGVAETEDKIDPLFTTRYANAILATISTRTSEQILSVEGKTLLRKEMLSAARPPPVSRKCSRSTSQTSSFRCEEYGYQRRRTDRGQ